MEPNDKYASRLEREGFEVVFSRFHQGRTEEELISVLRGVDGVIAAAGDPFTARVFAATDRLRVITRTGAGYDSIDVTAATQKGVAVCPNRSGRHAVAEYTMALILQCARKMIENLSEIRKGGWTHHIGRDLAGSTLGIIGLGTIGKEVAQRARAFEMRVLAYDLIPDDLYAEEHQVTYVTLEQLLRESDYVTLHTFLDAGSRHLINAERLAMMKPTAYLINDARGGLVDTPALCEALKEHRIAGAILDVFEAEPLPAGSPLRELENVYMAPHSSAATDTATDGMAAAAVENVIRVLRGERPIAIANPEVLKR